MIIFRILLFLFFIPVLISFGAIRYYCRRKNMEMKFWKKILCILLFLISWSPYASAGLLSYDTVSLLLAWAQFFLVWLLCYGSLFLRLSKYSVVSPIVFGLMLMEPAFLFINVLNGHISFGYGNGYTIDLSRGGDRLLDFLYDIYRIAFAVLPLVGVHYLMKSIKKSQPKTMDQK